MEKTMTISDESRVARMNSLRHDDEDKFFPASVMLNEQQLQLVRLLAGGLPDRSIARRLCLAPRTLARRISEIYRILGVDTRFQAGVAAQRLDLIDGRTSRELPARSRVGAV
jgi:DNA-binding NarL/FixJ family response regulator